MHVLMTTVTLLKNKRVLQQLTELVNYVDI